MVNKWEALETRRSKRSDSGTIKLFEVSVRSKIVLREQKSKKLAVKNNYSQWVQHDGNEKRF